jgi:hypothetical protein
MGSLSANVASHKFGDTERRHWRMDGEDGGPAGVPPAAEDVPASYTTVNEDIADVEARPRRRTERAGAIGPHDPLSHQTRAIPFTRAASGYSGLARRTR